ncbi:putative GTP-binding protein EngB [Variibacter gotjawalensis]|uniref:Probable GTP-binding protein EngB n=1 Tax=Variibacter gotjawalensis TaxID=1333996 RepID=A0A0S3PPL2_9BRAD|nr:ribosome biogenesis GTP-binding protein YihA/YsxC [Variibacter gotjawalensis]NIK48005.1 GTP-binding protein [Variibacter gotjawalensis]RZS49882.1 GTP-binding protein [Variibacter gotjawalensis]BAT57710.1 putative GTP-binding protein EngB [Variibacter gotjawalensis]
MASSPYTTREIENGRLLFKGDWDFRAAADEIGRLPRPQGIEIALAGRSNVGKSSLINALTTRKALARTSHTPGRTQELIFFNNGEKSPVTIVDMPGYGYAEAPKKKVEAWTGLIHDFLRGRANLARVYVLIDSRHGLKPVDTPVFDTLDKAAVSYAIVLTKADQVKPAELEQRMEETAAALAKRPAAFPIILATSSRDGTGIPELRAAVSRLVSERK